jgi:hypothetical protein
MSLEVQVGTDPDRGPGVVLRNGQGESYYLTVDETKEMIAECLIILSQSWHDAEAKKVQRFMEAEQLL